jgi:hypothetical protein
MSILTNLKFSAIEIVTAALVAALIVTVPAPLAAQQIPEQQTGGSQTAAPAAAKAAATHVEEEEATGPQKPGHGITVHGHWIIDVHDKDGKLVEHRDFHNSLYDVGGGILLRLLDGTAVAEKFSIFLVSNVNVTYAIVQSGSYAASTGANLCTNSSYLCSVTGGQKLTLAGNQTGTPTALVVSGQLTADRAVTFSRVISYSIMCHNGPLDNNANSQNQNPIPTSPADCSAGNYTAPIAPGGGYFTGTDITPLTLAQGQVLSVSVSISFS